MLGNRGGDCGARAEDEQHVGIGICSEEGQSALAVRMRGDETKIEFGEVSKQQRPDSVPPETAQEKEAEQREAHEERPPPCKGYRRAVGRLGCGP